MSKTLFGTTTVTVGDETYTLMPTLDAVRRIESRLGGLRGANQALNALSVDGTAHIVASGAGLKAEEAEDLAEKVWQAGVLEIATQVTPFLVALYNPRGGEAGKPEAAKASVP